MLDDKSSLSASSEKPINPAEIPDVEAASPDVEYTTPEVLPLWRVGLDANGRRSVAYQYTKSGEITTWSDMIAESIPDPEIISSSTFRICDEEACWFLSEDFPPGLLRYAARAVRLPFVPIRVLWRIHGLSTVHREWLEERGVIPVQEPQRGDTLRQLLSFPGFLLSACSIVTQTAWREFWGLPDLGEEACRRLEEEERKRVGEDKEEADMSKKVEEEQEPEIAKA